MKTFEQSLSGRFENMLSWAQLDALWEQVNASDTPWYLYEVGMDVPQEPISAQDLPTKIKSLDQILHDHHNYDYCGIVYADNPEAPTLVKIYGPKNLGASCGSGGNKVWPRWVLSHMKPAAVGVALDETGKPSWWKNFSFKRH